MDVLAKLDEELEARKDYTLEQKKRYIYLRTCQLFSYDSRYHYCTYELLGKKAEQIKEEIINYKINLENVSNFNVVCKNYSEDIYSVALKKLLDVDSEIAKGRGHFYVELKENNQTIKADATLGDLTRAKMRLMTHGYKVYGDKNYKKRLKEIDQKINYIDKHYDDLFWISFMGMSYYKTLIETGFLDFYPMPEEMQDKIMKDSLLEEVEMNRRNRQALLSQLPEEIATSISMEISDELLVTKFQKISTAIKEYNLLSSYEKNKNNYSLTKFEDAKYVIMDLLIKLSLCDVANISLFQDYDDKDWEFINIYPIHLKDGSSIYYALEKEEKVYDFHQVSESEAFTYVKELKGMNKERIYRK